MNNGCSAGHYVTRVVTDPDELPAQAWDALLAQQPGSPPTGAAEPHHHLQPWGFGSHGRCGPLKKEEVGDTGIEPVTPTVSR